MKVDIYDIVNRSEWSSEDDLKYKANHWFEKSSFQFFSTDKLIEEFGYIDCEEIETCGHFIPVLKIDVVTLKKEFIISLRNKEVEEAINTILKNDNYGYSPGYDVAFSVLCEDYPEIENKYYDFERNILIKNARNWCEENDIPYYTPFDQELKFNLNRSFRFALYYKDNKLSYSDYWLDKKNFHIVPTSTIRVKYGYKNHSDLINSSRFVLFFKKEIIKMKKDYIANFCSEEIGKLIKTFLKDSKNCSYEDAFFEVISSEEQKKAWEKHEKLQLFEEAKQWCIENNIPYYISKNRPDHLGSLSTE